MNAKRILAVLVLATLLAFGLSSCKSDEQKAAESTAAFSGAWDISSMTIGDQSTDPDDFETLKTQEGLEVFLLFEEDNEMIFYMFGDVERSTWEPKDATTAEVTLRGDTFQMKIVDEKLLLEGGDTKFEFVRGEDRNIDDYLLPEAEARVLEINPVVIADDDLCTITAVSKEVDDSGNVGINLQIQNKSDARAIYVSADEEALTVAGNSVKMQGNVTANPNEGNSGYLYVRPLDLGGNTIDALSDVQGVLKVVDANNSDELMAYPFSID